jgi:hypothetical protein
MRKMDISNQEVLEEASYLLLASTFPVSNGVRLLGISLSGFGDGDMEEKP